jgi:hypothetical protein
MKWLLVSLLLIAALVLFLVGLAWTFSVLTEPYDTCDEKRRDRL